MRESIWHDPSLCGFTVESRGDRVFGRAFLPGHYSDESSPVVLLAHGYPGTELNLDLACTLRDRGFCCFMFHYRGCWGSYGSYSIGGLGEDVSAVLGHIREHAAAYGADADDITLIGHSMGGFAVLSALAGGESVSRAVLMAPCDIGRMFEEDRADFDGLASCANDGYFPGVTAEMLTDEVRSNAAKWRFDALEAAVPADIPYLFIGADADDVVPAADNIEPVVRMLRARNADVSFEMIGGDHSFSRSRNQLADVISDWLDRH